MPSTAFCTMTQQSATSLIHKDLKYNINVIGIAEGLGVRGRVRALKAATRRRSPKRPTHPSVATWNHVKRGKRGKPSEGVRKAVAKMA